MTRQLVAFLCLGLSACASPEPASPSSSPDSEDVVSTSDFDAQAWLSEARADALSIEDTDLDDPGIDRMKRLANDLDAVTNWRRACDTYLDYETGEMVYDPVPPGEGHWVRGTLEIADISETEAVVAVTCSYGAYQGGYAFVHINGEQVAVLSTPELDDGGLPLGNDKRQTVFSTPDVSRIQDGILATFAKGRGLGDCGTYAVYRMDDNASLSLRQLRQRECGDDIPDELPPPSEWPLVYTAPSGS
ncbi:MAG: DUF1176 domain-containing protein [Bacteroidota bacterium]